MLPQTSVLFTTRLADFSNTTTGARFMKLQVGKTHLAGAAQARGVWRGVGIWMAGEGYVRLYNRRDCD